MTTKSASATRTTGAPGTTGGGKPGRRVRNFLIHREYQLRFVVQMILVCAVLVAALGWLVWRFHAEASRVIDLRALVPDDPEAQVLKEAFARGERQLLIGLGAFAVVLSVVLAAWQLVSTHRVAGPLYYIEHQIGRVRDGYLGPLRPLRKGDLLHRFFEQFRAMHESLRERARRDAETFARVAAAVEKAGHPDLAAELRAMAREREESLVGGEARPETVPAAAADRSPT